MHYVLIKGWSIKHDQPVATLMAFPTEPGAVEALVGKAVRQVLEYWKRDGGVLPRVWVTVLDRLSTMPGAGGVEYDLDVAEMMQKV